MHSTSKDGSIYEIALFSDFKQKKLQTSNFSEYVVSRSASCLSFDLNEPNTIINFMCNFVFSQTFLNLAGHL